MTRPPFWVLALQVAVITVSWLASVVFGIRVVPVLDRFYRAVLPARVWRRE